MARAILGLRFSKLDLARMRDLAAKARNGSLAPNEEAEIDDFERTGSILSTLKSMARLARKKVTS
jgi:hypothetical protein